MKKSLTVLLGLAAIGAARGEMIDLSQNVQLQIDLRNRIQAAGFDCLTPLTYRQVGNDYRGTLDRVDCENASSSRSFRIVEQPGQPPRVEPW
ncbi:hypothetical protein MTX26_35725 (plasmid) [Bradyrhizobium sp. ISRA443]|uniref:hypothetical protein n=1 Tax=unclassified Bradyrhizobium TaxID=2631580 RepID=UPI00247983CD|nr:MULTISPECIES: hypothetical protein [unclassified Bradyrhizobium]WGR90773.1 hypothetical protein MTX20_00115 [Bradyrhizobium sp. ISRA435]WGS03095.1 hypothetical protein MTX23_34895 [Bradyrhizobium sp. ISRA436]WGS09872.1 hypothetical protein MTX18_35720 [Bradyrhizobium sp. ISRA437]WGS16757.1 hypothetical protein MTX26_35725 [Bradyrhizobium sp. ISRA443]